MKNILKRVLKNAIYTFYRLRMQKKSIIDEEAIISPNCKIYNIHRDKTKIRVGAHSILKGELLTYGHGGEIQIGEYCYIGEGSRIWSSKKIIIGNRVLISHNVNIHDNNAHPTNSSLRHKHFKSILKEGHPKKGLDLSEKQVVIEDDAWIGFNSIILKGVTIGKGAIVGAGSVVVKNVEPYTLVTGNPATFIKKIEDKTN